MNTSATTLMTVEEAREYAGTIPDKRYELHDGQLYEMPPPSIGHKNIQRRLFRLLDMKLRDYGEVYIECPYRGTPEYDIRSADVGAIAAERYQDAMKQDEIFGAPDFAIEVLSPSNRSGEMEASKAYCFAHGTQSFWVIDTKRRTVRITTVSGDSQTFEQGDQIPLEPFAADSIAVNDIFA